MAAPTLTQPPTPAAPDPLAGLHDWHLPDPVSWWPPAPGWWLLGGLAVIVIALGWAWWWRQRRRGAAARAALRALGTVRQGLAISGDQRWFAAAVSSVLRRLALIRYPRERVAGLTGAAWLDFLDATGGDGGFTQGAGQVLGGLHYRAPAGAASARPVGDVSAAPPTLDPAALAQLAARWIKANREAAP